MVTTNPDKHIRKAVFDKINDLSVESVAGTIVIKCFDTRVSNSSNLPYYVLLTSQTKDVSKANKCEYRWETSLLIEIYARYATNGNYGSRVELNDIEEAVYTELNPLGSITGYDILTQNITFETQLETVTTTEIIYRSFLRLNLTLI